MAPNPFQTTYATGQEKGLPGQLANGENFNSFSRTVETAAGLGFGQPAFQGAADRGVVATRTMSGAAAVLGANTGNGTFGAITAAAPAQPGDYVLTITAAATNAGVFTVEGPDGVQIGDGNVGAAFAAGGLSFTLADGATDFVAGDSFRITVAGEHFLGITRRNPAVDPGDGDKYAQYKEAGIVDEGVIFVKVGAAVTRNDRVCWNPTTKLWSPDTANDHVMPQCRFETTANANTVVAVRIRRVRG